MQNLHSWEVDVEKAIEIQEDLRKHVILKNSLPSVKIIGGGDVAYREKDELFGAIVVLSFPDLTVCDSATATGKVPFPYIPGLLSFREGPILISTYEKLNIRPDVMIFEGQGIAHPRGFGLASHLGLWLGLPSIGCTKTSLLPAPVSVGDSRGISQFIRAHGRKVGAVVRTKRGVKPVFVSPGHRIDLPTSVKMVLATCQRFRMPEPLRLAHQLAGRTARGEIV